MKEYLSQDRKQNPNQTQETKEGNNMSLTFLNITSEITADAVKSAAMIIIIMPTGILLLSPVRDEIHPLKERERTILLVQHMNHLIKHTLAKENYNLLVLNHFEYF